VTAQGVGAVIGALTLPSVARRTSRLLVLKASLWASALFEALYAYAPSLWLSALALFALGAAYVGCMTGLNTSVQVHAPEKERSRVLSIYVLSLSVFYPIGALTQSALAHRFGVPIVSVVAAALFGAVLATLTIFRSVWWADMGSGRARIAD